MSIFRYFDISVSLVSEVEDALYAGACPAVVHVDAFCLDECGLKLQAEVLGDVEGGEFGIYVSVDDGQEIDACEGEDAEVAEPAEGVFPAFEDSLESSFLPDDAVAWWQHLLVAFGVRVAVHDVEVCLCVVRVHLSVPRQRVEASEESSVDDGQLPVFAVVELSCSRDDQCEPCGSDGVGLELGEIASQELLVQDGLCGGEECSRVDGEGICFH